MICPTCAAWSTVLETRQRDGGFTIWRRHRCANDHTFESRQVHEPVYCSAKQRMVEHRKTATERARRWRRDQEIRRSTEPGTVLAKRYNLTTGAVWLIRKKLGG